jgi:glycosyltransferase involved in cell wall biosynthesis
MNRIVIRAGRTLSNAEINDCYAQSVCVWNVYRRSTQSGVLPNAFMCGTPVVASRAGAFPEFVEDGATGRFLEGDNREGIAAAFEDMRSNAAQYSRNCRKKFLETFHYKANLESLRAIL